MAVQPLARGMRALVIGSVMTLVASLLALAASRGEDPDGRTEWTGAPLRPVAPVTSGSPSQSPSPSPSPSSAPASTSPSASPAPARTTRPSSRPPQRTVTAEYQVLVRWDDGHISQVTVRNAGAAATDWSVVLVVDDGVRMQRHWVAGAGSAEGGQDGTRIRLSGRLAAGASIIVDYQARRSDGASSDLRSCTVNGTPCR
jgi:hypothetical protein